MQITNDPIPALEGELDDLTICATGAFHPGHRSITFSQPCYATRTSRDEDDIIMVGVDDLPELISMLQEIQKTYENGKDVKNGCY